MKFLNLITIISFVTLTNGVTFDGEHRHTTPFGSRRSSGAGAMDKVTEVSRKNNDVQEVKAEGDDFDRAQQCIFDAVEKAEKAVLHAVEEEVDCFFHEMPHDSHNGDDTPKKSKKAMLVSSDHEDSKSQKKTKLVAATKAPEPKKPRFDDDLVECLHDCIRGDIE
mmetsp:Transcript_5971/g.8821  ORF Transcript_5971/g.8821 Transcript_5971/m.8821 type:complete len:165 (+) Transcript_5971:33-527(+)